LIRRLTYYTVLSYTFRRKLHHYTTHYC